MKYTFKSPGNGQAFSRICSVLLSLSFLAFGFIAVFSFEKAVQYTAEMKHEEEVAEVISANLKTLVGDVAQHFEEDSSRKGASGSAPSPLHLGIGKNFKVTVAADGKKKTYSVNSGTVSDILKKAGVRVGEYDILNHEMQDVLKPNMTVSVKRVTFALETQTVTVKHKTKKKKTKELYLGEMYIEQSGEDGEREDSYINVYVDGKFKKRSLLISETKKKAVTEVILTGTKKRIVKLDSVGTVGYSGLRAVSELPSKVRIELDAWRWWSSGSSRSSVHSCTSRKLSALQQRTTAVVSPQQDKEPCPEESLLTHGKYLTAQSYTLFHATEAASTATAKQATPAALSITVQRLLISISTPMMNASASAEEMLKYMCLNDCGFRVTASRNPVLRKDCPFANNNIEKT